MRKLVVILWLAAATPAFGSEAADAGRIQPVLTGKSLFEQVAVTTSDLPESIRFYRDQVGLPLLFETNGMAFFDVGGVRLMVAMDKDRAVAARPQSILYFHVDDFDSAIARLKATSIKLVGPVETVQSTADGDLRLQQFEDPDGNALAVMGMVPKK